MKELSTDLNVLNTYLRSINFLSADEMILSTEKPGEGNMNFTLRIDTGRRKFILKQSRAYVEKFPEVPAPADRIVGESLFYRVIRKNELLRAMTPRVLHLDKENKVMLMEDLGMGKDYTYIYNKSEQLTNAEIDELAGFLTVLHSSDALTRERTASIDPMDRLRNTAMRKLNHEHIFLFPYLDDNGMNLDDILPGLASISARYKKDEDLKTQIAELGEIYLSDGNILLHGDYFPGSWLKTERGTFVIDPEFCFYGRAEYEAGVMLAHLKMAEQGEQILHYFIQSYIDPMHMESSLVRKFAGAEILRRVIGLAQLPLDMNLASREKLLTEAAEMVMH